MSFELSLPRSIVDELNAVVDKAKAQNSKVSRNALIEAILRTALTDKTFVARVKL